jgi:hypothetical protein
MTLRGKRNETSELHTSPIQPHAEDISANHPPNRDDIRRRAYEIHLEHGGLSGRELADWLQAEAELGKDARFLRATKGTKREA